MKKTISSLIIIFSMNGIVMAKHTLTFQSANNLTTGTVSNVLLDSSSVTKRGQLNNGIQTLAIGSMTVAGTITSTSVPAFVGDGSGLVNLPAGVQTSSACQYFNLRITTNGGGTNEWVVTANKVIIGGVTYMNIATSCFMNKTGAGGTDYAEISSAWYKLHFIENGSTVSVFASTAVFPTLPAWPSGYRSVYFPVAEVRNDGSSNLVAMYADGNIQKFWNTYQAVSVADAGANQSVDLTGVIPPSATSLTMHHRISGTSSLRLDTWMDGQRGDGAGQTNEFKEITFTGTGLTRSSMYETLPVMVNRTFWYSDGGNATELISDILQYTVNF